MDGIADFLSQTSSPSTGSAASDYPGYRHGGADATANFSSNAQSAAIDYWPEFLGDAVAFGADPDEAVSAMTSDRMLRSLLLLDADATRLLACRKRLDEGGMGSVCPVAYAAIGGTLAPIRDAVADTVLGSGMLSGVADARSFLKTVHRVLKPNGHATFVVPNRRFHAAMCSAIARALTQLHARDATWPEGQGPVLEFLARTRRHLIHHDVGEFSAGLEARHLFDSEEMIDLSQEIGFATARILPLNMDPVGAETMRRICRDAGAADCFSTRIATLAATLGQPYFCLLSRRDSSAFMQLRLTKAAGPGIRTFTPAPVPPHLGFIDTDAALGGVAPRWSIELLAQDTPAGISVSVGGWCLCNTDIRWVRLTLNGVPGFAPVWRPRPDVHEVINRNGRFHALNAICSGLASELLFDGVHATDNACPVQIDILIDGGLTVSEPSPRTLVMGEPIVVAH
jgi:SAM-dependent methyltransferase